MMIFRGLESKTGGIIYSASNKWEMFVMFIMESRIEYNSDYLNDYFSTANFFYHHGLNSRLFHNLSVIKKMLNQLSSKQHGEYCFLLAIAQLRELQVDEALQNMQEAYNLGMDEYVSSVIEILNNKTHVSIEDFMGKNLKFSRINGPEIAHIVLEHGGRLSGYSNPNERSWGFEKGVLFFRNFRNERTSLFFGSQNGLNLVGPFLNGKVIHSLQA